MNTSVLVVEDDENIRLALTDTLEDAGYSVRAADSASGGGALWRAEAFDVIVLDVMLGDGDGLSLLRQRRHEGADAMVLMLTARGLEDDVVTAFAAGANDYVTKPYRSRELVARVAALARRGRRVQRQIVRFGPFALDLVARTLTRDDGHELSLTPTELELLICFVKHPGRALHRDTLLDSVWGREVVVEPRTVDNFVSNLRRKLGWDPSADYRFKTVRGYGYRFDVDVDVDPGRREPRPLPAAR